MSTEFDCIKITTPHEWHETFIKFGESVSVNRCQDKDCSCGAQFHCPFCEPKSFKEINAFRVQDHLEQFHWPAGVQYKDLFIVQCLLHCAEKRHAHYHCPVCTDLVEQREEFVTHLQAHLLKQKESVRLAYAPDTQQPEHLVYEDYTLTLCGKDCSIMFSGMKHYHCPGCGELRWNCATIAAHLSECEVLNKHRPYSLFTATKQRQLIDPRIQFAKHWHESMVRDNYDITVRRCTPKCCGKQYHCPLCTSKTKPCMVATLRKHFSYHLDHSVKHKGYLLLACCLDCVKPGQTDPGTHYHCPYCGKCVPDRVEFTYHLMACEGSTSTSNHDDVEDIPAVDNDFSLEDRDEEWFKVRPKISRPKQQQIEMFESVFATLSQSFLKVFNMETSDALKDMLTEVAGATHVEVCSSPGTDPRRPGFALKGRLQNVLKTESRLSEKFNEVNQDETLTLKTYYTPLPEKPLRSSVSLQTSPVLENVRVKPLPPSRPAPHGQHQTCACPSEPCNAVTDHGYSKEAGNQSKPLNTDEPFHLEKTNINVGSQVALVGKESRTLNNVGQKSTSVVQNTQQAEGNSTEPSKMTISEAVKALSGLAKLIPTRVGLLRSEAQGVHQTFIIPSQGTPQNSLGNAPGAGVHLFQLPGAPSVQLGNSAKANERPSSQSGMSSGKITFVRPKSVAASRLTGSVLTTQTSNENMTDLPVTGSKRPAEVTPADQNMVQKKQDVTEPKRLRIVENVQNVHGHILSPQASSGLNALRKTPVSATVLPSNNSMGITNPASPLKTAELGTPESPKISTAGSKSAPQIRSMAVEDHSNITALIPLQIVPSAKEASEVSDALKYLGGQAKQTNQHPVKQQAVQTSDSSSNCDKASKVADGITVVSSSSNRLSRSVASDKQPIALSTERRLTRSQIVNSDGAKNISFSPIQSVSEGPKTLQDSVVNVKSTAVSPLFLQDNSPAATKAAVFSSDQSSPSESPRRYYTRSLKNTRSPELPCKLPTTQNDRRTPNILKRGCTSVISPAKGNSLLVKQNIKLAALTSDCSLDSETLCEKANTSAVKSTVHSQKSESQVAMVSDQVLQILSSDDEQESELIHPDLSFEIPTIRFQLSDAQGTVSSSHSWTKVQGGTQIGKPQTTASMPSNSVSNGASEPGKTSPELPKRYFTRGRKVDTSVLKGRGKSAKDTTDRKKTPETAKSTRILRSYMSPKKSKKGLVSLPSSKQPESPRKKHLKFETPLKSTKPGTVNKKNNLAGTRNISTNNTNTSSTNTSNTSQGKKKSDQEVSPLVLSSEDLATRRKIPTVRFQLDIELGSESQNCGWTVVKKAMKSPEQASDNIYLETPTKNTFPTDQIKAFEKPGGQNTSNISKCKTMKSLASVSAESAVQESSRASVSAYPVSFTDPVSKTLVPQSGKSPVEKDVEILKDDAPGSTAVEDEAECIGGTPGPVKLSNISTSGNQGKRDHAEELPSHVQIMRLPLQIFQFSKDASVQSMQVVQTVPEGGSVCIPGACKTSEVNPPTVSQTVTQTRIPHAAPKSTGTQMCRLLPEKSDGGEVPVQKSFVLVQFSGASSQSTPSQPDISLPINHLGPSHQNIRTTRAAEVVSSSTHTPSDGAQSSINTAKTNTSKNSVSNTNISTFFIPAQPQPSKLVVSNSGNLPAPSQKLDVASKVTNPTLTTQDAQVCNRSILNLNVPPQNSVNQNQLKVNSSNTSVSTLFAPAQPSPSKPVVFISKDPPQQSQQLDVPSKVSKPKLTAQDAQVSNGSILNSNAPPQNSANQNNPKVNPSNTSISTSLIPTQPQPSKQVVSISEDPLAASQSLYVSGNITQSKLATQVAQVSNRSILNQNTPRPNNEEQNNSNADSTNSVSNTSISTFFIPAHPQPTEPVVSNSGNPPSPSQQRDVTNKVTTLKLATQDAHGSDRCALISNVSSQNSEKHNFANNVSNANISTFILPAQPPSGSSTSSQTPLTKNTLAVNNKSRVILTNRIAPNAVILSSLSTTGVKSEPALKLPEFLEKQSCYLPNIQTGHHTGDLKLERTIKRSKSKHVGFALPNPKTKKVTSKSTPHGDLEKDDIETSPITSTELPFEPYSESSPIFNEVEILKAVRGIDAMVLTEKDESTVIEKSISPFCPICRRKFEKRASLPAHIMASHFKYRCQNCLAVFTKKEIYVEHLKSAHKTNGESRTLMGSPNPCGDCNMTFTTRSDLDSHQRKFHNFEIRCSICAKTFSAISGLRAHIMTYHLSDGPSVCDVCGKSFRLSSYLASHRRRHFSERNHVCSVCGKRFKENYSLKEHMDIHKAPGERKYRYMCSYCGKGFNCKPLFRDHTNCHTGEKPHKCPTCDKTFCRLSSMKKHELTHTDKRPFACEFCVKAFKSKEALKTHVVTHTGVSKFKCNFCHRAFGNNNIRRTHVVRCEKNPNRISVPVNTRRKQRRPEEKAIVTRALEKLKNAENQAVEIMSEVSDLTVESDELSNDAFVYMCTACNEEFDDVLTAGSHIEHCTSWK